jgi:thiamine kinase-like enzyme
MTLHIGNYAFLWQFIIYVFSDKISFIDHEYAMFNYQPYDIGNHFCEYAGIYFCEYAGIYFCEYAGIYLLI